MIFRKKDLESCHRLGKANPKNTIVRFADWKFCFTSIEKKSGLKNQTIMRLDLIATLSYF